MKHCWTFPLLAASALPARAANPDPATMAVVRDAGLHWADHPAAGGFSQAVVHGDPSKPGLCAVRVKFAPGVVSQPFFHPGEAFRAGAERHLIDRRRAEHGTGTPPRRCPPAASPCVTPPRFTTTAPRTNKWCVRIAGIGPSGTTPVNAQRKPK